MPTLSQITKETIREHINRAVNDVFSVMLSRSPTAQVQVGDGVSEQPDPTESNQPMIVATVGFVGEVNGLVYLRFGVPFARICAGHLLGLQDSELDDETVNDAIGEMANMTVGSFKNGLCDAGFPCMLTIPSVMKGGNLSIMPLRSTVRHVFQFDFAEHQVVADILVESGR